MKGKQVADMTTPPGCRAIQTGVHNGGRVGARLGDPELEVDEEDFWRILL